MQFSTKIDGFEQKDSQGFENSYNSYSWTIGLPIREIFHFHHLPKLYFGFKPSSSIMKWRLRYSILQIIFFGGGGGSNVQMFKTTPQGLKADMELVW